MPDLPHKDSFECIRALEAEIRALRMLLEPGTPTRRPHRVPEDQYV